MSATLTGSTHLLVPIHIDALLVGKEPKHFSWANLAPDYSKLKRDFSVGADLRDLSGNPGHPPKGLYLHFRLPTALTHSQSDPTESGELDFPRIPNRWLVVRSYQQPAERHDPRNERCPHKDDVARGCECTELLTKAWLIRSDAKVAEVSDDEVPWLLLPVPWPLLPKDGPLEIQPTGSCEVLTSPFVEDDTEALLRITAVGNGDVGFSAHYPACRSILGFHDDLKNVPEKTKLSYLVAGWYSAAADDLLHVFIGSLDSKNDQEKLAALSEWLKKHRWSGEKLNAAKLPSRIICHGLVRGVHWQGPARDYSDIAQFEKFNKPDAYSVEVGNSSAEALASLLARKANKTSADPQLFEDVLTAFQTGLLSSDPTISELDAELHRQGFAPVVTGKIFMIQPETRQADPTDVGQLREPLPQDLQGLLHKLNASQQECDRYAKLFRDYRWELYALWHRWIEKCMAGDEKESVLKSNLDGLTSFLENFDQQVAAAKQRRDSAKRDLTEALGKETVPRQRDGKPVLDPKYRLTELAADRFYVPNDPVVLVSGPALKPKGTYTPAQSDTLPCRVTGQEVLEYTYDIENGKHGNKVAADERIKALGIGKESLAALPVFAQRLFSEAALLEDIIKAGRKPEDIGWRMRPAPSDRSLPRISGRMPAALSVWDWIHNPWIPVYLTWEYEWLSDYPSGTDKGNLAGFEAAKWRVEGDSKDARSDAWKYRRQVDLFRDAQPPAQPASENQTYEGYALLARPTFLALAEKLRDEPKIPTRVKEIAESLQALLKEPMLSQALAGFHDALIMRRVGDQLPPLDYKRFAKGPDKDKFFLDPIHNAKDRFDCSPSTTWPFYPIRAGRVKLQKVKIIDTFGQAIELDLKSETKCRASQRLEAEARPAEPDLIQLRPRSVCPMRLNFAPAPAGNPATIAPASSPICGWVVPNQFDQNLTLYAANGKPLGALQKRFELKAGSQKMPYYWVDVPGTVDAHINHQALDKHLAKTIENPHLLDFAHYIRRLTGDQSSDFSRLLDSALAATEQRVPEEDPGVSVLVGRPLALVRAEIRMEIPGLPAFHQNLSWKARGPDTAIRIRQWLETNGLTQFPKDELNLLVTGGAESVRWPVRLGDRWGSNDGLVGFFAGALATEPRPFFASWGFGGTKYEKVLEHAQNLTVDCITPVQVTLLMDPQARVHATSGVLPRVFLELPAADSAGAKGAREVFFQTAPVLGPPATPQIPKPSDDYGEWSWAYRPAVTNWAEPGELVSVSDRSVLSEPYATLSEGWLKLKIDPVQVLGLWVRDEAPQPAAPTLAWSVRGAESLQLLRQTKEKPDGELVEKWSQAPLPSEFKLPLPVDAGTTFVLVASDEDGYQDKKEIIIRLDTRPPES